MTQAGVRVSSEWLDLREPADAAARAGELAAHLVRCLPSTGVRVIHDLAGGTGSMGRWLAPRIPGPQLWVVHDLDPMLLRAAAAAPPGPAADGAAVRVQTRCSDITRLTPDDLVGADLITASALLDLLTARRLEWLMDICAAAGCPVLVTLSVDGRVALAPSDPLDARVAAAFNAHQRRATAAGRLLGPDAVAAAVRGFRRRGAEVLVRPSPWRLGRREVDLAQAWLAGWVGAACEHDAGLAGEGDAYTARRLAAARSGSLGVMVGHTDLLVLP